MSKSNWTGQVRLSRAAAAALFAAATLNLFAWPATDECTQGSGCFSLSGGGTATFNFTAFWDVDTSSQNGQFLYTDSSLAPGGLTLNSSTLLDYSVLGPNSRAFAFDVSGGPYAQARVFVTDNGATGDTIQIQLLDASGVPLYDTLPQPVSTACGGVTPPADCRGGISIGNCSVPSPCQLEVTASCGGGCEVNGNSGSVTFVYTIRNAGSTSVSLGSLTATDSFGPLDLSSIGSGTLAPGDSVALTLTENLTGPFPFVNTVTVSGGSSQCSDAATVTIQQRTPPPGSECDDFITGGGWILGTPSGAKGNFGVHGGIKHGQFWGGLNYLDHGTGLHVKSTAVTAYTELSDVGRQINFSVTIDGRPGTATVKVYDNGEPGRSDTFEIQLSDGYKASGDLGGTRNGGGNLQLHKSNCGKSKGKGKNK